MRKSAKYSPEVRERAVRMVLEPQGEHESQWAAIGSIAGKFGCAPETLRLWVRQHERDQGLRGGLTTAEQDRIDSVELSVIVDECLHRFDGRSSSAWAKYALALRRISLACRSSRFSRSSCLIHSRTSWRTREEVEWATLQWVDWFNHRRLLEPIGNIPPAEKEAAYYQQRGALPLAA